jgi:hypothetical protein
MATGEYAAYPHSAQGSVWTLPPGWFVPYDGRSGDLLLTARIGPTP